MSIKSRNNNVIKITDDDGKVKNFIIANIVDYNDAKYAVLYELDKGKVHKNKVMCMKVVGISDEGVDLVVENDASVIDIAVKLHLKKEYEKMVGQYMDVLNNGK